MDNSKLPPVIEKFKPGLVAQAAQDGPGLFAVATTLTGIDGEDQSAVDASPTQTGPFTQTLTFTGGTGAFAGVSGSVSGNGLVGITHLTVSGSGNLTTSATPEPASAAFFLRGLAILAVAQGLRGKLRTKAESCARLLLMLSLGLTASRAPMLAQDPNSICCIGLAPASANAIDLPLQSKVQLWAEQSCPAGRAVRAISFSHQKGQDLTYQESFSLQCATSASIVTTDCAWSKFQSNWDLQTDLPAPPGWVVAGVRFTHKKDENFVYQQSFAIKSCRLQNPAPLVISSKGGHVEYTTKWHLQRHASCYFNVSGKFLGLATSLGFSHEEHYDNTSQEFAHLTCTFN